MAACGRCAKSAQVPFIRHWTPWIHLDWLESGHAGFAFRSRVSPSAKIRFPYLGTRASATITNVLGNRRFACLFLGLWLGAAASIDFLVALNFSTIGSFISAPEGPSASAQMNQAGQKAIRLILRRNAAEENARIFKTWEWSQIGIASVFFILILSGEKPPPSALVLIPAMFAIVLIQHFIMTPQIVALGREVDEIPATELLRNPTVTRFWTFHGIYSGCEILKLLLGIGVGARLIISQSETHSRKLLRQNG
jgi:hypothetical protein